MKVLVTGAAGYIGSVVTESLCNRGFAVVSLDSLRNGHRQAIDGRARFLQLDLLDRSTLNECLSLEKPDAVVHLAAEALIDESIRNPALFYRENIVAGLNLLDAMVQADVKRLVFSSSAAVYGVPERIPIQEEDAGEPCNPYGETKWAFERALKWYREAYGIQSISLRYFSACGATLHHGEDHRPETHIVPLLFEVALGFREVFQLFGRDYPTQDGTCIRDYVHVLDIANAHLLALEKIDKVGLGVFNIGDGFGYSNSEVIEIVRCVTGHPIRVILAPCRPGDPPVLIADARLIMQSLGWKPSFPKLEEMISSAWEWRKSHPEGYAS